MSRYPDVFTVFAFGVISHQLTQADKSFKRQFEYTEHCLNQIEVELLALMITHSLVKLYKRMLGSRAVQTLPAAETQQQTVSLF